MLESGSAPPTKLLLPYYFYAIVRDGKLVLSEHMNGDILAALELSNVEVDLVPSDMLSFEIFSKSFPIRLTFEPRKLMMLSTKIHNNANISLEGHSQLYLYTCSSIEKEDWYIQLLRESKQLSRVNEWVPSDDSGYPADSAWFSAILNRIYCIHSVKEAMHLHLYSVFEQKIRRSSDSFVVRF